MCTQNGMGTEERRLTGPEKMGHLNLEPTEPVEICQKMNSRKKEQGENGQTLSENQNQNFLDPITSPSTLFITLFLSFLF